MNSRHDRIGSMFVRGPKALHVNRDGVGNVIAYIHNNPVRAGVVGAARESMWTSHRGYLDVAPPAWLHVQEGLALSGFADANAFDEWVMNPSRREYEDVYDRLVVASEPPPFKARPAVEPPQIVGMTAQMLGISDWQLRSGVRRTEVEVIGGEVAVFAPRGSEIARGSLGRRQPWRGEVLREVHAYCKPRP
jgi:hypothetical protein